MCVFAGLLMLCMMCVLSMCSSRIQSGVMRDEYGARYGDLQQRMNDATSRQQEVSDLKSLAGKVVSAGTAVASLQSSFAKPGVDVSAAIENLKSYMTESAQAQCFGWYAATGAAVAPVWEFAEENHIPFFPIENADHRFVDAGKMEEATMDVVRFFWSE